MTEFPAVLLTLGVTLLLAGVVGRVKSKDNEFCWRQGLIQAVDFTQDPGVGKDGIVTKELGTGELCSNPNCDAFKSISCR